MNRGKTPCPPCGVAESKARRGRYERACQRWAAARTAEQQRAGGAR